MHEFGTDEMGLSPHKPETAGHKRYVVIYDHTKLNYPFRILDTLNWEITHSLDTIEQARTRAFALNQA